MNIIINHNSHLGRSGAVEGVARASRAAAAVGLEPRAEPGGAKAQRATATSMGPRAQGGTP